MLMRIAVDFGHNCPPDIGAVGIRREDNCTMSIGNLVVSKLRNLGNTVINVTPAKASSVIDSLKQRVDLANISNVDLYVSIHMNAFNGTAKGSEVLTYGGKELQQARATLNNLEKLGFKNRCKDSNGNNLPLKDGSDLYVIKNTKAPSMLVECCFCDNKEDMAIYDSEKIANAIVKGITGKDVPIEKPKEEVKEVNKVEKILVIHNGGADQRAAEYLADFLQCPTISKANSTGVLSFYDKTIVVGGNWKPIEDSILITGSDRYDTLKAVLKYMNKL